MKEIILQYGDQRNNTLRTRHFIANRVQCSDIFLRQIFLNYGYGLLVVKNHCHVKYLFSKKTLKINDFSKCILIKNLYELKFFYS